MRGFESCRFLGLVFWGIVLPGFANDRLLNQDLVRHYTAVATDYTLLREKLLKQYRESNTPVAQLMAFHRRFSPLDRHESELKFLLQKKIISPEQADQFRLVFYLVRGPVEKATEWLFKTDWNPHLTDWLMAMKLRYFLLLDNEPKVAEYAQAVLFSAERLQNIYPWIFYIPLETQSWRMLVFLKRSLWPRVVAVLEPDEVDKPFFEFLTQVELGFPSVPLNTRVLKEAPPVYSALKVMLWLDWLEAVYMHDEAKLQQAISDMEYYYPNSLYFLRIKMYLADKAGNLQLYLKLQNDLKLHDPHFWSATKNKKGWGEALTLETLPYRLLGLHSPQAYFTR
jgi:hypothetical protein